VDGLGTVPTVTPNWLAAPAQGWGTGGGPGLPPEPVPPQPPLPKTTFSFPNPALDSALKQKAEQTQRVVVAVLDTSPDPECAKKAGEHYRRETGNTALATVVDRTNFRDWPLPSGELAEFAHLVPFWANRTDRWQPSSPPENRAKYFNIVDHGLFVAGVVLGIAPDAEVHLYRVLDDVGVGSLAALLAALNALFDDFLSGEACPRLIVNLSLLIEEVPPTSRSKTLKGDDLYGPLFDAIEALRERDVLIVAAAGNDSLDLKTGKAKGTRHDPRLPARHNQVLSVAAIDQHDQPATFSNRSDSDAVPNGIAIFGGNATIDTVTKEPEILDPEPTTAEPSVDLPPVGIIGVYSNPKLPFDKGDNESGLVYWAGTSFATPVISGLAARRWSQMGAGADTPDEVIADLDGFTSGTILDLRCKAIKAHQPQ
jgi:subtilisin family serine protease